MNKRQRKKRDTDRREGVFSRQFEIWWCGRHTLAMRFARDVGTMDELPMWSILAGNRGKQRRIEAALRELWVKA